MIATEKYYKLRQDLQKKLRLLYDDYEKYNTKYYETGSKEYKIVRDHIEEVACNIEEAINNLDYFVFD